MNTEKASAIQWRAVTHIFCEDGLQRGRALKSFLTRSFHHIADVVPSLIKKQIPRKKSHSYL